MAAGVLGVLASVATGALALFVASRSVGPGSTREPPRDLVMFIDQVKRLQANQQDLRRQIEQVGKQLDTVAQLPPAEKLVVQVGQLRADLDSVKKSVESVNSAIIESPEKALALPLLRRDVEALRNSQASEILSLRGELGRLYDLDKWLIGLMGGVSMGLLGLGAANLLQVRRSEGKK